MLLCVANAIPVYQGLALWQMPLQQSIKCLLLQCEYQIQVQLLEIYNEQLRDLLDNSRSHARLDIRNTERSGLNVPDAIQVPLLFLPAQLVSMATLRDSGVQQVLYECLG